jgi:hypothetical protein
MMQLKPQVNMAGSIDDPDGAYMFLCADALPGNLLELCVDSNNFKEALLCVIAEKWFKRNLASSY